MITKFNLHSKYLLYGIFFIFLISIPFHFLYDFSGHLKFIGLFVPVNESIFEHLKLAFYPISLYWFIGYFIINKKEKINPYNWFICGIFSSILAPIIIAVLYYSYISIFNNSCLALDIIILFLSIAFSQIISLYIYERRFFDLYDLYSATSIFFFVVFLFIIFTFAPPHFDIFMDPVTKSYGII